MSGGIELPNFGAMAQGQAMKEANVMQFIDMTAMQVYAQLIARNEGPFDEEGLIAIAKLANNSALILAEQMGKISIQKNGE